MAPIIITLAVDPASQRLLNTWRKRHFPPERNFIDAHITLFHALAGLQERKIITDVHLLHAEPFEISAEGLRFLGRGVAISIRSDRLLVMRAALAAGWGEMLTAQDREWYRPHVTIQNKVTPSDAKALLATWQLNFSPFAMRATGLSVWRYLDGPWGLIENVPFGS